MFFATYQRICRFNLTIGAINASYIVQMVTILDQTWINQFQVKLLFGDQKMIKDEN